MRRWLLILVLMAAGLPGAPARAHEVRPAYLEIRQTGRETFDVLWKVPAVGDRRLGIYVTLPAGAERLGEPRALLSDGAYVERWSVRCEGGLAGREVRIAGLAGTRIDVLARVEHAGGAVQTVRVLPDHPAFVVQRSPSGAAVSAAYLVLGVEHILLGIDHLLFVLALVLIVRGWRRLTLTVTAFTLAHSLTLALASLGVVRVPGPPVEACIALSIVFVAAEVVRGGRGRPGLTERAPWAVAFTFGLLHGLGFAGALIQVGLPAHAVPLALLSFNVGVECAQLGFIALVLAALAVARRLPVRASGWGWRVPPYAIGSVAMVWVIQRVGTF